MTELEMEEKINAMREVINQHSRDLRKLNDVIKQLNSKIDRLEKAIELANNDIKRLSSNSNPFGGLF